MKKYFNLTQTSANIYVYGDIVDDSTTFLGEGKDEFEFDPLDLKAELEELNNIKEINIYINSGGGSVFAASTMVSILKRYREQQGVVINAYVDGICASAATYLLMMADNMFIYRNSVVMIHKPMTFAFGNANDLEKDIETLNVIENDMMIPMYLSKATIPEEDVKALVDKETWFSGAENSALYFGNYFNVTLLEESKQIAACSSLLLDRYTNTPTKLKNATMSEYEAEKPIEEKPEQPMADNSLYNYKIKLLNY